MSVPSSWGSSPSFSLASFSQIISVGSTTFFFSNIMFADTVLVRARLAPVFELGVR